MCSVVVTQILMGIVLQEEVFSQFGLFHKPLESSRGYFLGMSLGCSMSFLVEVREGINLDVVFW